jgi:hypothetical protein
MHGRLLSKQSFVFLISVTRSTVSTATLIMKGLWEYSEKYSWQRDVSCSENLIYELNQDWVLLVLCNGGKGTLM